MTTVERIADEFVGPLREAQAEPAATKSEIATNNKIIASQKLEIDRGAKRMAEQSQQEMDLNKRVNAKKTELTRIQNEFASVQSMFEALRKKLRAA